MNETAPAAPKSPLNIRVPRPALDAGTKHVRALGDFLLSPTQERLARLMAGLQEYQTDWIIDHSGEPK